MKKLSKSSVIIIVCTLLLAMFGCVMVYSASKHSALVNYSDEFFYLKTSSKGMNIDSYRETYKDNKLINTQLLRQDRYKVQNAIKVFGSKPRELINPSHSCDERNLQNLII
jgi:hypothetical protein